MKMSLFRLFVYGIPQSIAIVFLAWSIAKADLKWKKIIPFGIVLAWATYLVRLTPTAFGVHTIVNIIILTFLTHLYGKAGLLRAVYSVLISYVILVLAESGSYYFVRFAFHLTLPQILHDEFLLTVSSMPAIILLVLTALLVKYIYDKKDMNFV